MTKKRVRNRSREKFWWDRSSSEPDLSYPHYLLDRWPIKFPHEYISVDEIKYFRRRKPPDFQTRSNICLYDEEKPVLPFSSLKTEYQKKYRIPNVQFNSDLLRRTKSLKLDGHVIVETEHKSNYLPFSQEELHRYRASPTRIPENLFLSGEFNSISEYRSAFIPHPLAERRSEFIPRDSSIINRFVDMSTNENFLNEDSINKRNIHGLSSQSEQDVRNSSVNIGPKKVIHNSQISHLNLGGEMSYMPEYRSQYIEFPIERAHSIPQLSSLKLQGQFIGMPEYRESFKSYDIYSKSAPIKKSDHIRFSGKINSVSEYTDKFKESDKSALERPPLLKTEDHLLPGGDFTKDLPEYFESYKDPQIHTVPERGRCREPYLRLKGKIEFDPEYRSTYLDYPRSRPIIKKSTSTLRLTQGGTTKSPHGTPKKKFHTPSSPTRRYHDPSFDPLMPFIAQPEYRKARHDYSIKQRPLTKKITEDDGTVRTITKNYREESSNNEVESGNIKKLSYCRENRKVGGTIYRQKSSPLLIPRGKRDFSPPFKLTVENVDGNRGTIARGPPKFGRRASTVTRNAYNARDRTGIIEGNSRYVSKDALLPSGRRKSIENNEIPHRKGLLERERKHNPERILYHHNCFDSSYSTSNGESNNCNKSNGALIPVADAKDKSFLVLNVPRKKSSWMQKSWH